MDWLLYHSQNLSKSFWAVEKSNWNSKGGTTQNYREVQVPLAVNNTTNLSAEEPRET